MDFISFWFTEISTPTINTPKDGQISDVCPFLSEELWRPVGSDRPVPSRGPPTSGAGHDSLFGGSAHVQRKASPWRVP